MQHDFKFLSKKDPKVVAARDSLLTLLSEVRDDLKSQYTFQHRIVGSYARNMITYDEKSNVGFDLDVNIFPNDDGEKFDAKQIKWLFKMALDKHVLSHGFDYAEDSTRVLTVKAKDRQRSRVLYSIDFAFVYNYKDNDNSMHQQYIHYNKKQGSYTWEEQPKGFYMLPEKIKWIKAQGIWESALKPYYLEKKNYNKDPHTHSRTIFANVVHEICQKYGYYQ